jgi:hypothetical protein
MGSSCACPGASAKAIARPAAARTWHPLKGENQLPKVLQGVRFRNGVGAVAGLVGNSDGVVSSLFNEPQPALARRRRPRHGQGWQQGAWRSGVVCRGGLV